MKDDPIVSEVRRIREEIGERFNFDIGAMFADLKTKQKRLGSRLVRRQREDAAEPSALPDRRFASLHGGR